MVNLLREIVVVEILINSLKKPTKLSQLSNFPNLNTLI